MLKVPRDFDVEKAAAVRVVKVRRRTRPANPR